MSPVPMRPNPVYKPREDSHLLASAVEKYAFGRALDMGTGSGFLAMIAAKKKEVVSVLAVDVNTGALEYARKKNIHPKITYMQSDLFSNIKGKFDTIIFNPPYLPEDKKLKDVALDGGRMGYEVLVDFLKKAKGYLKDDGQILFLFSTLTKKEVIDRTLIENAYLSEEAEKRKLDFEELFVCRIKKLESLANGIRSPEFLAKGKRGLIYTFAYRGKKAAIKIKNPKSESPARIFIEGNNLKQVNRLGIGPRLLRATDKYLIYEFVEGTLLPEFIEEAGKKDILNAILQVFLQMRTLDINRINKEEMTNPRKHIIVTPEKKVVLIDFERAHKTPRPHNVTQFCQYVASDKMQTLLKNKGIIISKKQLFFLAKEYKRDYDEDAYRKITEEIIKKP